MAAEIVNLRRVKRQRAREADARAAEQARAQHGRSKQQRVADATAAGMIRRVLDGARIDRPDQD